MKIGQFSETFLPIVDGVGRVVYSYAETLSDMGHECYVITPDANTGFRGKYPFEIIDFYGVQVIGAKQYKTGIPPFDFHYGRRIRKVELDIVHAHSPFLTGYEALRLKRDRNIPLVATFHSKYYDDFYKATGMKHFSEMGVKAIVNFYNNCDEVWAVSKSTADVLHDYGYEKDIFIMENGTTIYEKNEEWEKKARQFYNLPEDKTILLFVGQINFKKNLKRVVEAMNILSKESDKYHLVFAGQGPDRGKIEHMISDMNITDKITFTGHVTETDLLFGLYMTADLFVFPSLYDNAPMVLREAATMGTPSILTEGSSSAEIVKHAYNAYISKDDSAKLAELIAEISKDKEALKEVGENARKTIPIKWRLLMGKALDRYNHLINLNRNNIANDNNMFF